MMKKLWLFVLVCSMLLGACALAEEVEMVLGGNERVGALNIDPGFLARTEIHPQETGRKSQWYRIWSNNGGAYNLKVNNTGSETSGDVTISMYNRNMTRVWLQRFKPGQQEVIRVEVAKKDYIAIEVSSDKDCELMLALCMEGQHFAGKQGNVIAEATCISDGVTESYCYACDILMDTEIVPASGHISSGWVDVKPVTCTADGVKEQRCTACGMVMGSVTTAAFGHSPGEWKIVREQGCTQNGLKEKACLLCDSVLESETLDALGHRYTEWEILTEATKEQEGERRRHCIGCGDTHLEKIEKLPKFLGIF